MYSESYSSLPEEPVLTEEALVLDRGGSCDQRGSLSSDCSSDVSVIDSSLSFSSFSYGCVVHIIISLCLSPYVVLF